jgi:agmatinase
VRGLRGLKFVGFDLVEVQPQYDHGEVTCLLAGTLLHEFLALLALNRRDGAAG